MKQPTKPDLPFTDNAETWKAVRKIAAGKLTMEEAQVIVAVACVPNDQSHAILDAVKKRCPGFVSENDPGSVADRFLYIFHRQPDACLEIMQAVRKWYLGATTIQRALLKDNVTKENLSATEDFSRQSAARRGDKISVLKSPTR
jgi:hypothetical protein